MRFLTWSRSSAFTENRSWFIDIPKLFSFFFIQIEWHHEGATAAVRGDRNVSRRTTKAPGKADPEFKGRGSCLWAPSLCAARHGGHLSSLTCGEGVSPEEFLFLLKIMLFSDAWCTVGNVINLIMQISHLNVKVSQFFIMKSCFPCVTSSIFSYIHDLLRLSPTSICSETVWSLHFHV